MFDDLNPEEMKQFERRWKLSESIFQTGAMLGKTEHYQNPDMRIVDAQLKEAISKMCEWNKGGDEKFYQLGRQYLRMGLALTTVIEDLQSLFTAVAGEYGD